MSKIKTMTKDELLKATLQIINKIDDDWLLWQIYRMVVNMTK